jgi:hypothetical protein
MPLRDVPLRPLCKNNLVCGRFAAASTKVPRFPVHWTYNQQRVRTHGLCTLCLDHFGELNFVSHDPPASCVVCLEDTTCSVLMHCEQKEHVVCVKCFSLPLDPVMYSGNQHSWPSPQQFGCPEFETSAPIDADLYSQQANAKIYTRWALDHQVHYRRYLASCEDTAEMRSKARTNAVQALQRCPVCRAGSPWDGTRGGHRKCAKHRLAPAALAYLDAERNYELVSVMERNPRHVTNLASFGFNPYLLQVSQGQHEQRRHHEQRAQHEQRNVLKKHFGCGLVACVALLTSRLLTDLHQSHVYSMNNVNSEQASGTIT